MKSIYLVAYYVMRPKDKRVRTNRADWQKQANAVSYDEQITVTQNLKNRDLSMAKVILDFVTKRVVKNDFVRGRSFDDLFMYFLSNYPEQTKSVMEQCDPVYLAKLAVVAKQNVVGSSVGSNTMNSVDLPVETIATPMIAQT